jgi:ABC-2 type transport system permease protein
VTASSPSLALQVGKLAKRSVARTLRQPAIFIPNLLFPLFLLAVFSGASDRVTAIKGFPTNSYVTFILGGMMIQAAAGATTMAGIEFARDIESGFLDRLSLTPVRGFALVAAQLAGVAVFGIAQTAIVLGVGIAAGASLETGVLGGFAVIGVVLLMILAFGAAGLFVAVRAGAADPVQGVFSMTLALFFLSSMAMPRDLITENWFEKIATFNPLTYPIEAARSLFITGWDVEALALGCGVGLLVLLVTLTLAVRMLRGQVSR